MDQAHVKLTFNFSPLNAKFWLRQGSELYSRTWPFALGIKQNSFERNNLQAKSQTFLRPAYVLSPSAWTMEDVFAHMFVFVRHRSIFEAARRKLHKQTEKLRLEWKRSFRTLLKQFSKINLNSWRTYHVRYLFLAYSLAGESFENLREFAWISKHVEQWVLQQKCGNCDVPRAKASVYTDWLICGAMLWESWSWTDGTNKVF